MLNLGAALFVRSMGTKAIENNNEVNIKGSYWFGLLKFNNSVPTANPAGHDTTFANQLKQLVSASVVYTKDVILAAIKEDMYLKLLMKI